MIGLIGAMPVEMDALLAQLQAREDKTVGMDTFHSGLLFGQPAVLGVCGPGKVNAAICAQSMVRDFAPDWVLNLGVAGAADDRLNIGDLVIASSAVQHDMDTSPLGDPVGFISKMNRVQFPCDAVLSEKLLEATSVLSDAKAYHGIVATGDQFIGSGETRLRIRDRFDALAVEMEGGAVAHVCTFFGTPFGILRSISDRANGDATMDYPAFTRLAAAHSVAVVETLLRGMKA